MEYKNNHYIAQMLLERFMNEKNELFYFDKTRPEKAIIHRNPEKIFSKNHLYTARDKDGKPDVGLERDIYKKLDNAANDVIEKIVVAARTGKLPQLSSREKNVWDEFFTHQQQRTPDFHMKVPLLANPQEAIGWSVERYEKLFGPVSEEDRKLLLDEADLKRIHQSAKVEALKRVGPRVIAALASRGIGIVRIKKPNKSFIIGSLPIVRLQVGKKTLDDPSVEAWFPIAHDIAVTPDRTRGSETLVEIDDHHVRVLNEHIFRQSTEVAGRSRELLESLAGVK